MRILLCLGTRPEAIKMASVIHKLSEQGIDFKICNTAQHKEMLLPVLDFFKIVPDYDLNLMRPGQTLNSLSSEILKGIDLVLNKFTPDIVLVQGDTTTAFTTALGAFHKNIRIGHIEAGLRTYNMASPFPEEGNRQLISRIADFHFVPTSSAKENLIKELIDSNKIFITGNTVIDALQYSSDRLDEGFLNDEISEISSLLQPNKKVILVTGHRRENLGIELEQVCEALIEIADNSSVQIIFPVHLNPQVKKTVHKKLEKQGNIYLTGPMNYPAFLWLIRRANLIISDSGGIQEEAPSFTKPVLVTRDNSERMEGVDAGFSFLVGTDKEKIVKMALEILNNEPDYEDVKNPYGDGKAAERIVTILKERIV